MKPADLLAETLAALNSNRVRSGLTILGIVVGIASVILLVSIGQGTQASIESQIQSVGSNLLIIMPGFGGMQGGGGMVREARGSATSLTLADAEAIAGVSGVADIAPVVQSRQQVVAGRNNTNTSIYGITPDYATVRSVETSVGDWLTERDDSSAARVAVLGPTTATDLFGEGVNPIGQKVRINGIAFKVVGVTVSKGGSGFNNQDDVIYAPLSTVQRLLIGSTKSVQTIYVQASSAEVMDSAKSAIETLLTSRHNITDSSQADFSVMSQADILKTATSVTGTLTALLAAISGISLLVGGIGIMNMMLTTVTERTREIGLRKALGARRSDITSQFLAESVMLTVIGGIIGISIGWGLSLVAAQLLGMATKVSLTAVLLAVGVCTAIGVAFGYYPAYRASRLNPIEALRYQ